MRRTLIQSICSMIILAGVTTHVSGQTSDDVNDIVQQAMDLARNAQSSASPQTGPVNPFSQTNTTNHSPGEKPAVDISDSEIRINVGGREIVVPRNGSASGNISGATPPINGQTPVPVIDGSGNVTVEHAGNVVSTRAWQEFATGMEAFSHADYSRAVQHLTLCVEANPQDTTPHPFVSLALFAVGEYDRSAEYAYSAAGNSPQWTWDQLRSYYGQNADYPRQYEQLQLVVRQPQSSVSARFLLGWHHLMLGHRDAAATELELVARQLPGDPVISRWLEFARQPVVSPPAPMR